MDSVIPLVLLVGRVRKVYVLFFSLKSIYFTIKLLKRPNEEFYIKTLKVV